MPERGERGYSPKPIGRILQSHNTISESKIELMCWCCTSQDGSQ